MTPPADVAAMAAERWCVLRHPASHRPDEVAIDYPGGSTFVWSRTRRDRKGRPTGPVETAESLWQRVRERLLTLPVRSEG